MNGQFELNGVPLGRQSLQISFLGYEPSTINNLLVSSGKEIILQIKLQESYHAVDEITVTAGAGKSGTKNEMAMISSRSFSVEETERFAGRITSYNVCYTKLLRITREIEDPQTGRFRATTVYKCGQKIRDEIAREGWIRVGC